MLRPSNGLLKKQTAPAFNTPSRTLSSGNAVMNMSGMRCPSSANTRCRSTPLIPGICTSTIAQAVSDRSGDCRSSCAEANVRAANPRDLTRLSVASRIELSSSTIAIVGIFSKEARPGGSLVGSATHCTNMRPPARARKYTYGCGSCLARHMALRCKSGALSPQHLISRRRIAMRTSVQLQATLRW
jgi:hypothetical protein